MSFAKSIFTHILAPSSMLACVFGLLLSSCGGKQSKDQQWVDSVLQACDSITEDTLVYDVDDQPVSQTVDEYFYDFLYTFTHNSKFKSSRTTFPLSLYDENGDVERTLNNVKELDKYFAHTNLDYYVMFLSDVRQLEDDPVSTATNVELHLIDPDASSVRRFGIERINAQWMLNRADEISFDYYPYGDFLKFYNTFSTDSTFQYKHIAQPLDVSIPDTDEPGEYIDGTIDADQFPLFTSVIPSGEMLVVDFLTGIENPRKVVLAKCGLGSGMMDVLTFEEEEGDWKLISIEQ